MSRKKAAPAAKRAKPAAERMPSGAALSYRLDDTERFTPGSVACPGCGGALAMRHFLRAMGPDTAVVIPACCWAILAGQFPYCSLTVPTVNCVFAAAGALASGISAGLRARKDRTTRVMAWVGDGGTYDIGLQSLSGALERNEDMLYVCYDNEAYMNTGIQRSGATPRAAHTSTAPAGKIKQGKEQNRKDLTKIMVAHNIPYVAQTTPFHWKDLATKVEKALAVDGPAFLNVLMPCTVGWHFEAAHGMQIAKEATETCFWPLFEVENGQYKLNYKPKQKAPLADWLKQQGRYKHVFRPGNEHLIEELQTWVDEEWAKLLALCGEEA